MRFRNFVAAVFDALEAAPNPTPGYGHRVDAAEGQVFFARELENIRTKVYEVPIAEFKGRKLVPVDHSVDPGAETDTYEWTDSVGKAEYVADFATTPPRVDVYAGQVSHSIRHMWLSYAWNAQELRAAAFARKPLPMRKAKACREGIEALIDEALLLGHNALGVAFKGLFTLASTNTYTVPNGGLGSPTWANKTPREILADLHAMGRKVYVDSNEIERIDTLVLPTEQYGLISERPMGDGDNVTILKRFLADSEYVKTIETSPRLASNSAWTGARMVGYRKDPDVVQGIIPLEPTQGAPQLYGLESRTIIEARCGGVQCYRPKAVIYGDGI